MAATVSIARVVVAAVLLVSGVAKYFDRAGTANALRDFGLPEPLTATGSIALPATELAISGLLLAGRTARWAGVAGAVLFLAFAGVVAWAVSRGRRPDCHCFGRLHAAPSSWSTVVRNLVLAGVASLPALMPRAAQYDLFGWIGNISVGWALGLPLLAINAAIVGSLVWAILNLMRQNGRLLVRLEALEADVRGRSARLVEPIYPAEPVRPAPDVRLRSIDGDELTVRDLMRGALPVLMVFLDPGCGPCRALAPEVARWQADDASSLSVVVAAGGQPAKVEQMARRHQLRDVVLVDRDAPHSFGVAGTPAAVLIDAGGLVHGSPGGGADAVRSLRQRGLALRTRLGPEPTGQHRPPVRRVVGDSLTGVVLEGIDGRWHDLGAPDGEADTSLLVFWNPRCGFCQRLLPDLREVEAERRRAERVVLVASGGAEANREPGLRLTLLLDDNGTVAASMGVRGTPSACRIDATGRIASQLAVGEPAVRELLLEPGPDEVVAADGQRPRARDGPPP